MPVLYRSPGATVSITPSSTSRCVRPRQKPGDGRQPTFDPPGQASRFLDELPAELGHSERWRWAANTPAPAPCDYRNRPGAMVCRFVGVDRPCQRVLRHFPGRIGLWRLRRVPRGPDCSLSRLWRRPRGSRRSCRVGQFRAFRGLAKKSPRRDTRGRGPMGAA